MATPSSPVGTEIGKKIVALVITVVILLIVHQIAASLPMLRHAPPLGGTSLFPLALTLAIIDTLIFVALVQFGIGVAALVYTATPTFPESGRLVLLAVLTLVALLAYHGYDGVLPPLLGSRTGESIADPAFGGQLIPIAKAYHAAEQSWKSSLVPNTATQRYVPFSIHMHTMQLDGQTYLITDPQNGRLYDLIFLILIAAPIVGIVVIVFRNMDAITNLVFRAGQAAVAAPGTSGVPPPFAAGPRCAGCGAPMNPGAAFCPHCGAPAAQAQPPPPGASAAARHCPACGAENVASARFCKQCGGALATGP